MNNRNLFIFIFSLIFIIILNSCSSIISNEIKYDDSYRLDKIPDNSIKVTPENDLYPPILHSDEFTEPKPMRIISTAGAEDSPFIPADRDEIYFMFVKDVREKPEVQVTDNVNGIWVSKRKDGEWTAPTLVLLQKENEPALNGAEFVDGNEMIFASAREGFTGLQWFKAIYKNDSWDDWKLLEFTPEYEVGELHIYNDIIYFHSYMDGGKGNMDIWYAEIEGNHLSKPVNLDIINTESLEGWPYVSPDGNELWYTGLHMGTPAIYRSINDVDGWGAPEMIVSQFAGEPTLDRDGNLYFVHHYYNNDIMIESDIYIAKRVTDK